MQDEPAQGSGEPEKPARADDLDAGDVERAIQDRERVNMASLKLPDTGAIPEDLKRKVVERVQAIRRNRGVSLRALAQQLGGTHEAILSQVLRRQYDHEDSDHIRRLNAWAESVERRTRALRPVGICDTGAARLLRTGCDYAKSQNWSL